MNTSIVINFNGDGQEAIALYTKTFGLQKPEIQTYGQLPPDPSFPISEEEKDYVMSATINIQGLDIMVQDLVKAMQKPYDNNITISVSTSDKETVNRWFQIMEVGGQVTCPLQAMPWSQWYGAVKDKFGTSWQFQVM